MPKVGRGPRDRRDAPIATREPQVICERPGRGKGHRACPCRARLPLGLQTECAGTERREVADVRPLQDEPQRALTVPEDEQGSDENDEMCVEAAECGRTLLKRPPRRALRHTEVNEPSGEANHEERDREARLLPVLVTRAVEIVENKRQAGESARRRVQRDL